MRPSCDHRRPWSVVSLVVSGIVGPRVAEAGEGRIPGLGYSAPFEDLRLKN